MFCSKCGSRLSDDAKFCNECGNSVVPTADQSRQGQSKAVTVDFDVIKANTEELMTKSKGLVRRIAGEDFAGAPAPEEYQKYPHPYHNLGGWLGLVAYSQLAMVVFLVILIIGLFVTLFTIIEYLGAGLGVWLVIVSLVALAGFALCAFVSIKFFLMIYNKNPRFLRFFELLNIIGVSIFLAMILLTGFSGYLLETAESIGSIISIAIDFFIWTTYFRKSVRVRTYFGSDEYLRRSIFFKNAVAPPPADTRPYTQPLPYTQPASTRGAPARTPAENAAKNVYCGKCGARLTPGARFCGTCGEITAAPSSGAAETTETVAPETPAAEEAEPLELQKPYAPPANTDTLDMAAEPETAAQGAETSGSEPGGSTGSGFFSLGEYVIDEKVSMLKFTNAYKVFDVNGAEIGAVEQQNISGGAKAARLLLGGNVKSMQSFRLDIKDVNGETLASIQRDGISSGIGGVRTISVLDGAGQTLGAIKLMFSLWTPKQEILSPAGELIGRIQGDWKGWNFVITDAAGYEIGAVNKRWSGAMKELFTTADKYRVSIFPQAAGMYRVAVVAAAITLDMVLKESK
jgi:uncharacterized protein YxjI/ribosomal protein L40E